MRRRWSRLWLAGLLMVAAPGALGQQAALPTPPTQPQRGPGGAANAHQQVARDHFGAGAFECWTFAPADPAPATAPVVVFCHGWMAMQPWSYTGWIEHLVKRGSIVVYPRFQSGARTPAAEFAPNVAASVREALARLRNLGDVRPDVSRVAVVGHSVGGLIATDLAVRWAELGIPRPRVLLAVEPGGAQADNRRWGLSLPDVSQLAQDTLVVCLSGSDDRVVNRASAEQIIARATQVPPDSKAWLLAHSDRRGAPALVADHAFPTSPPNRAPDALDFNVCWKLLDGLLGAAFASADREYALGDTPQQRSVGTWSDGVAVTELEVSPGR